MKKVLVEKYFSPEQRLKDEEMIRVFFDKEHQAKRHADGLKIIKQIIDPIVTCQRMRKLPSGHQEKLERGLKLSYKTPDAMVTADDHLQLPSIKVL